MMKVAIIGAGNMAQGLSTRFASAGYDVTVGARDLEKARALPLFAESGLPVEPVDVAVRDASIVLLAVLYGAVGDVVAQAGDLAGKIVVDITNPITPDYMSLTIGHSTSAAEEIQKLMPSARVVKAFNTIFAQLLTLPAMQEDAAIQVFYAADDEQAGDDVARLIRAAGFNPVYSGKLGNARYLEPLAELNIHFGYDLGWGTLAAPAWIRFPTLAEA